MAILQPVERLDGFPPRFLEPMERSPPDPVVMDIPVEPVPAIYPADSRPGPPGR